MPRHTTKQPGGVTFRTKQRAPTAGTTSSSGVPAWFENIMKQFKGSADKPPTQPDPRVGGGRWRKSADTGLRDLERFVRSPGKRATEGQVRRGAAEIGRRRRKQLSDRGWFMERVPVYNAEGKAVGTTFKRRRKEVPIRQGTLKNGTWTPYKG
jgi:hypothetical protein